MLGLCAIVAVGAIVTVAGAHTFRANSEVDIAFANPPCADDTNACGEVDASRATCETHRKVEVWEDDGAGDAGDDFLGRDKTGDTDEWEEDVSEASDLFSDEVEIYAKVLKRKSTPGDHKHICKSARSEIINVTIPN